MRRQTRQQQRIAALRARGFCVALPGHGWVGGEERPRYGATADTPDTPPAASASAASSPSAAERLVVSSLDEAADPGVYDVASPPRGYDAPWLAPTSGRVDGAPSAADALALLTAAIEAVQAVDWDAEAAADTAAAPVVLQQLANRLASAQVSALAGVDRRDLYALDGSVSLAAWLRNRSGIEHSTSARLVSAARRLPSLPQLAQAFADGDVSLAHVTTITRAAVPSRAECFAAADAALTDLAKAAPPSHVGRAARFLADQIDPDGSDPKPAKTDWTGKDPRRDLTRWQTVDGLTDSRHLEDVVDAELTSAVLDAFDEPDPPDTPAHLRRSPGQRRADAFAKAMAAAAASVDAPTVHGAKPHALAMFDLARFMGRPDLATFKDQLRYGGEINLTTLARLLDDAMVTIVLTLGPWRVVNVGRTHRTLPPALRPALQMLHRHCRGPDCDRPAAWTQAHHQTDWKHGGATDLNQSIPLCQAHHTLVTSCGWTVTLDLDTGDCTWTAPNGRTTTVAP